MALPLDLVDSLHEHLNSVDHHIRFILEKEKDGQLPFLDILLSWDTDGSISTSVCRQAHSYRPACPIFPSGSTQAGSHQDPDGQG